MSETDVQIMNYVLSATMLWCPDAGEGGSAGIEVLSERQERLVHVQQGWGELGIDLCAHAPDQAGLPLQIKDKTYARGLGHHAPGEIVVELDGATKGMGLLHLLGEVKPADVKIGMKVRAVWKPARERKGDITDIRYFRPMRPDELVPAAPAAVKKGAPVKAVKGKPKPKAVAVKAGTKAAKPKPKAKPKRRGA